MHGTLHLARPDRPPHGPARAAGEGYTTASVAAGTRLRERLGRGRHRAVTLSPIPSKLKQRIRRGEYIRLAQLLHANLTRASLAKASGSHRRGRSSSDAAMRHASATVTNFCSWSEAWSVYAAVLSSFRPHLATRTNIFLSSRVDHSRLPPGSATNQSSA